MRAERYLARCERVPVSIESVLEWSQGSYRHLQQDGCPKTARGALCSMPTDVYRDRKNGRSVEISRPSGMKLRKHPTRWPHQQDGTITNDPSGAGTATTSDVMRFRTSCVHTPM